MISNEHAGMNEDSFKLVFETYKKRIYGYVLTLSRSAYAAEEITQDIFIKLWLCRDTLEQVENLDSYIFAMAHNKTLNYLRKVSHDLNFLSNSSGWMYNNSNNNVDERLMTYDYDHLIEEAVRALTPQRKLVYELSRTKGLKHHEIASFLHLSPNTVKNHLAEALRSIRRHLFNNGSIGLLFIFLVQG